MEFFGFSSITHTLGINKPILSFVKNFRMYNSFMPHQVIM